MRASTLSLVAGFLMTAATVKGTLVYGEYTDNQCQNPIFMSYHPVYSYEDDEVCTSDGLVPDEKFVSIGNRMGNVSWDNYPNLNDGAVAVGAYWSNNQCTGEPEEIVVFYAPYQLTDDDSAVYDLSGNGACFTGGYHASSRYLKLKNQITTTSSATTTTTETAWTSSIESTTATIPSTTESATTGTASTSTYNPIPTSSDGTGPTSSDGTGPTSTYSITTVTRSTSSSKSSTTPTTTSSQTPSPTPGSASRIQGGSVGALVAGIMAALMI